MSITQSRAESCLPAGSWGRVTAAPAGTGGIGSLEEQETKAVCARAGSTIPAALAEISPLVV